MPTKIPWCDEVWNYVTGCELDRAKILYGCEHCYAQRMAVRLAGRCGYYKRDPFRVTLHPSRLDLPVSWKKPRVIFVNSMGDLFHDDVKWDWIFDMVEVMQLATWHRYIILTKRPERLLETKFFSWPQNVYIGASASNQKDWSARIKVLEKIDCLRLMSVEPMLGPVRGTKKDMRILSGVFCGPETGPGARRFVSSWLLKLMRQCTESGVPFFDKRPLPCAIQDLPLGCRL